MSNDMSWLDEFNAIDPNEVGDDDFAPLPDGWHEVLTSDVAEKPNKSGTGHHVSATLTVVGDDHNGRKLWANFNVDHPSATVKQIGQGQFRRFVSACGIERLTSLDDLDDRVLLVKVGRDKRDAERNEVKAYKAVDSATPKPDAKPAANKTASSAKKPWEK